MLRVLGRRALEAGISVFAILGFCYVPLGTRTGLEHAKAVFGTPAAKRAGGELVDAFTRVRNKLTGQLEELAAGATTATSPVIVTPPKNGAHSEHAHPRARQ